METVMRQRPSVLQVCSHTLMAAMIVFSGVQVAGSFWHLASPQANADESVAVPAHVLQRSLQSQPHGPDMQQVKQVFVVQPAAHRASGSDRRGMAVATVETRLALTLKGSVMSNSRAQSRAIIASGNEQAFYRPGDKIESAPGTVVLQEIHQAYVILDNNGRPEVLRMDQVAEQETVSQVAAMPVATPVAADTSAFAGRALTDLLRIQPVFADADNPASPVGLQIRHGSRQDFLKAVGLQQGDLITAIDGQALTDAAQLPALMDQLSRADQVALTLLREGQVIQVQVQRSQL